MCRYFKKISNTDGISEWKPKGLSGEIINHPTISDNSLAPALGNIGNKTRVKLYRSCLKQNKIAFTYGKNSKYIYCL